LHLPLLVLADVSPTPTLVILSAANGPLYWLLPLHLPLLFFLSFPEGTCCPATRHDPHKTLH